MSVSLDRMTSNSIANILPVWKQAQRAVTNKSTTPPDHDRQSNLPHSTFAGQLVIVRPRANRHAADQSIASRIPTLTAAPENCGPLRAADPRTIRSAESPAQPTRRDLGGLARTGAT